MHAVAHEPAFGSEFRLRGSEQGAVDDIGVRRAPAAAQEDFHVGVVDVGRAGVDDAGQDTGMNIHEHLPGRQTGGAQQCHERRRLGDAVAAAVAEHVGRLAVPEPARETERHAVAHEGEQGQRLFRAVGEPGGERRRPGRDARVVRIDVAGGAEIAGGVVARRRPGRRGAARGQKGRGSGNHLASVHRPAAPVGSDRVVVVPCYVRLPLPDHEARVALIYTGDVLSRGGAGARAGPPARSPPTGLRPASPPAPDPVSLYILKS